MKQQIWEMPRMAVTKLKLNENLASSATQPPYKCRFGRLEANAGSDKCQSCSHSGGLRDEDLPGEHTTEVDYVGCPDSMPEKI